MFDLISVGDSTIDTLIQIQDAHLLCDLDQKNCKICFSYGEKIPVQKLIHVVAGNAANNAVGAKKLGLKNAIYTNVGGDSSGKEIIEVFKRMGVDTRYVALHKDLESNFSAVINFKGERTIFVYHQAWDYKLPELDRSKWVYYTSLSESFVKTNISQELINYVQRTGTKLFYNPGTYQIKHGVKKYPQLLALAQVLIVNKQEAQKILGYPLEKEISTKKLLKDLRDLGPKMVIITDGANGSFATEGENYYQLAVFPAKLVEMTGAGDAYATGVLTALCHGEDLPEAMRWGAANSASVIEGVGAQQGLLDFDQMKEKLKQNNSVQVAKIR